MARSVVEATARSDAPRGVVWAVVADGARWSDWGDWETTVLEREGEPAPDGVGAIRRMVRPPLTIREQVELWEPERRFGYRLLSGLPVRDYHAVVTLSDHLQGGTEIRWQASFAPPVPGTVRLLEVAARKTLEDLSGRLAAAAGRRGTPDP